MSMVRRTAVLVAGLVLAAAAFLLGRATAPDRPAGGTGDSAGSYVAGVQAGEAEGRAEGRAEQVGSALPADQRAAARAAFEAGYAAGADDAFAGYDGGWTLGVPWVVTLEHGAGPVAYRIAQRTPLVPGVDYSLCADGRTLCQRPR